MSLPWFKLSMGGDDSLPDTFFADRWARKGDSPRKGDILLFLTRGPEKGTFYFS